MFIFSSPHRLALALTVVTVMASACSVGTTETESTDHVIQPSTLTTLPTPTDTVAATTAIAMTTSTTLLPPSTTTLPAEGVESDIAGLIAEAERIRGLGFASPPEVTLLDDQEFSVQASMTEIVNFINRDRAHTSFLRVAEVIGTDDRIEDWRESISGSPQWAFYDAATENIFILLRPEGYGPLARSEIIHEVIHALTDQHYGWFELLVELQEKGADDRLVALNALIEGDATYFQLVYVQEMSDEERRSVAEEFLDSTPDSSPVPPWVLADFTFAFDAGFEFVRELVDNGGIASLDRAYLDLPTSSEQILHPGRYRRSETPMDLGSINANIGGYELVASAVLGEWGLRQLIGETMLPGMATQTIDGWGGDSYVVLENEEDETVFVMVYLGDTESDTEEVTQAFIDFAEDDLKLGSGSRFQGGQAYSRSGRPWMFVDREASGLLVILSTKRNVGRDLAQILSPP